MLETTPYIYTRKLTENLHIHEICRRLTITVLKIGVKTTLRKAKGANIHQNVTFLCPL